jgi:hypothetical protein
MNTEAQTAALHSLFGRRLAARAEEVTIGGVNHRVNCPTCDEGTSGSRVVATRYPLGFTFDGLLVALYHRLEGLHELDSEVG